MTREPDLIGLIEEYLDEHDGQTPLPDATRDAIRAQLPSTHQRPAWWPVRRPSPMTTTLKFGLAAAVAAVAVLIGINFVGTSAVGGPGFDDSTPTPEATATPEPTPAPTPEGNLTVGQTFDLSLPQYPVAIGVTVPAAGWSGDQGGGSMTKDDADSPAGAGVITFVDPEYYVYGDPCQWSTTKPDEPATTVDELVTVLTAQASRDASEPVDITLDGYAGTSITLHVPDDAEFAECDEDTFASWGVPGEDPARYHQGPGQIDELWILDVEGHLVVIDAAYYEGTPQAVVEELHAIVESTVFE